MKAIIIQNKSDFTVKLDDFNAIEPVELITGEYFLPLSIIDYLEKFEVSELIAKLWKCEIREITESDLLTAIMTT